MISIKQTRIFLIGLLLLLSACGYHLRGQMEISEEMKKIAMQSASSNLVSAMKQLLRGSGAQLVSNPSDGGVTIKVLDEQMQRRVLSLDSTGRANEFELSYRLDYQLLDAKGKNLSEKPRHLELYRSYFNDQIDILAKNNEESVIREEIYRQAAKRILSQARMLLQKR
jgi:LPS-assembly lipoprotein